MRFTQPAKWDNPWFRALPRDLKLLWVYMCDRCDWAGVWRVDPDRVRFEAGIKVDAAELPPEFEGRVKDLEDGHWWLRTFLEQQKNLPLNPENRAHKPIIASLVKHGLYEESQSPFEAPSKPLARGTGIGIGKGKGTEGESEGKGGMPKRLLVAEFDALWESYPRKEGKASALDDFIKARRAGESLDAITAGVKAYAAHIKASGTEPRYIKQGGTWFHQKGWLDDYSDGTRAATKSRRLN